MQGSGVEYKPSQNHIAFQFCFCQRQRDLALRISFRTVEPLVTQGVLSGQPFRRLFHKQILDKVLGLTGNIVEGRVVEGVFPERDVRHRLEVVRANKRRKSR